MSLSTKISDLFARSMTAFFRLFADLFFRKRYGHRALVLETVAGVPGMVAGMMTHLYSLQAFKKGHGTKIHEMLAEAENERKHLMFFMEVIQPWFIERIIIIAAQFIFWHYYLVMFVLFPRTAHRMTGYFEQEAVQSYTNYLELIEGWRDRRCPCATDRFIDYYSELHEFSKLSDMIKCIRRDEMHHAKVNHAYADGRL